MKFCNIKGTLQIIFWPEEDEGENDEDELEKEDIARSKRHSKVFVFALSIPFF